MMVMPWSSISSASSSDICFVAQKQVLCCFSRKDRVSTSHKALRFTGSTEKMGAMDAVKNQHAPNDLPISNAGNKSNLLRESRKFIKRPGKQEHHLWHKRDSTGSGQKALNLVRIISRQPNEKQAVYSALDKWIAWETEFPSIAAAKALSILRKRSQWKQVIQVAKWMLSKGQGATMSTYDCLLLAFDMDGRVDEAETLWNVIVHAHNRSTPKRLFSRIISLFDHHNTPNKVIEVFADMEELGVKPDEDTMRRISRAFKVLGQEDKQRLVMLKYQSKWKYIHFNGERVRVRNQLLDC